MAKHITIINMPAPQSDDVNDELQWLGSTLGLFGQRDRDQSCFRIFITLLKSTKLQQALSSDEIASDLKLTRGTVIHHINRLIDHGIVLRVQDRYVLRMPDLQELIQELYRDIERSFNKMQKVAQDIDRWMGHRN